jgi:carboxypeptidase C (cathepsin A)
VASKNSTVESSSVEKERGVSEAILEPISFIRDFVYEADGESIRYRTVAGETIIRDQKEDPIASFFTFSYLRVEVAHPSVWPVTFVFNGGPGSSSQWLHIGAFGPKRIVANWDPGNAGAPPYLFADNSESLLAVSDLVFIDPIGTGYSRPLGGKDVAEFCGLLEDAQSIADFIQIWITDNQRWNSPKYIAAESYGTVRASVLADILSSKYIALNGIVLIAAVLDYQNSRPRAEDGGILSYVSFLPTMAAVAWYHKKTKERNSALKEFLEDVRLFARSDYAQALIANFHRLNSMQRKQVAGRLADMTGLSSEFIIHSKLRIPVHRFFKALLRSEGLVIGRLDGRYTGVDADSAGEVAESDPTFDSVGSAFTAGLHLLLEELGVKVNRIYASDPPLYSRWNWLFQGTPPDGGAYVNVVPFLGRAMRRNKDLRVLVASGYYDLATPFFGAENALSQDGIAQERVEYKYYEVGHMIFLHDPSRVQFLHDIRKFISGYILQKST